MLQLRINHSALLFLFLAVATFCTSVFLMLFTTWSSSQLMVTAISVDLTITTAFFVFLFLRKQKLNLAAIGPVFILLLIVSSFIIPPEKQSTLLFLIDYVAPLIELTVLGFVFYKIYKARKHFISMDGGDFQRKLEVVLIETFNNKIASRLAGSEISMFYYLLFKWKKDDGFTYHRNSGILTILVAVSLIAITETVVVHLLLVNYLPVLAWILFFISAYSSLQVISLAKAVTLRPVYFDSKQLYLHYGWLMRADIDLSNIQSVQRFKAKDDADKDAFLFMGLMRGSEEDGVMIETNEPVTVNRLWGTKETNKIFLPIDQAAEFVEILRS
ncbi:MAG: hypothetical protein AAFO69_00430 [Bacteroidota bacterium]